MSEDTLLIQQTLAGDEQAFHRLSVKYQSAIYSLILSYVRNPDDAQEIMQDVFLKAYQGLSSLRQSERFRFWLYQLARNHCQDWKRKNQTEFQQLTDKTADGAYPADELLILRETLAKIMQAIDELPETEKRILKERYLDDSSYSEIQAKHGLSYKALNMRLLRAKQKVRARVEKLLAGIGIFSWHDALKKMLSGGVEAVKISAKVKIVTIGVAAVLVLCGTGVIVRHAHNSKQSTQINSMSQVVEKPKSYISQSPIKKTVSNNIINKSMNESSELSDKNIHDKKVSEANAKTKMTESNTNIPVEGKNPIEILKKYNAIMSSPEFLAEARSILIAGKMKIIADAKRIEELKNREKELENNLQNTSEDKRSDIENELAKTKDEIWETRVNMQKQAILDDDAYQKMKLKYITVEEIRIAQQEMKKTPPPFPVSSNEEDNTEEGKLNSVARTEALKRLKADGWTPNPLRSYQ